VAGKKAFSQLMIKCFMSHQGEASKETGVWVIRERQTAEQEEILIYFG
jgi:hypothetical protein